MGVSRKLAPLSRGENSISDVGFQWSSQRYSLEELSARFRLPVVVQCVVESCQVLTSSFTFDLSQPLVLHSSRCRRKIKARSLAPSRSLDPPSEVGPPLVIPEDYDGWFVAGGDGAKPPCYTKVVELAEVAASRVLVAKRHLALVQIGSSAGVTYTERHLEPGEVLAVMGQCKGELTLPASSPFRRSRRFLRCVDERGDSLLLCLQQRGAFYQVAPRVARDDATAVVSPKQLIASRDQFPLQVRHVMGEPPVMLRRSFPRLLRLDSVFSERSMLAAPLVASRSRPRPLEVAVRSRLLFRMALNHGQLLRTREGVRALDACESGGGAYFSAIKVAFTLRPEVSPLDDLDLSLYETGHRRRPAVASSESPRPHVSRRLPLELQGSGSPDSLRGERGAEDSQRQGLEEAGRPATRRAREYHGEPLSDSDSDSDEGQVINGDDDDDDDLDDDQASAACDVDAQSEFEIDWEPERLEGQNSSSPINGSLAGDWEQGPGEQRLAADSVNSVRETFSGTNDHSTVRPTNSEPHIRRDSANHSMTSCAKVHRQFQISFENDVTPQTNGNAHDMLQEQREVLKDMEEEQAEEQEEQEKEENEEQEKEEDEEKGKQKEEQEGEKADEHGEGREEEEQEEDLLREEDKDEVEVDEALATLETLDLDDDDNYFLQEETQQEEEQENQRNEEKEEEEKEEVRELWEEEKEEEIAATIEEMVMPVNETEVLGVQEDEEEDIEWRHGQDGDDDDDRVQEHIQGQERGLPKEKGIEAQWTTLWITSSGIPPLPNPRPPRRPPPPSRRLPPSPNPDIPAGPPPLPPRAPCAPTVSPKPSQILDILVLNEDFTTPVEV